MSINILEVNLLDKAADVLKQIRRIQGMHVPTENVSFLWIELIGDEARVRFRTNSISKGIKIVPVGEHASVSETAEKIIGSFF